MIFLSTPRQARDNIDLLAFFSSVALRGAIAVNRLAAELRQSVACRPIVRLTALDCRVSRLLMSDPDMVANCAAS